MSPMKLWFYKVLTSWMPESRCFGLKNVLLRWVGAKIGRNVRIYSSARVQGTGALEVGDDVHVGSGVFLCPVAPAGIRIGSHVDIGPGAMILTGSLEINRTENPSDALGGHIAGKGIAASVAVGDGCWLGARSLILPGVTLAEKTVVAAGAVVTHSVETPKALLAGVPAQCKKKY